MNNENNYSTFSPQTQIKTEVNSFLYPIYSKQVQSLWDIIEKKKNKKQKTLFYIPGIILAILFSRSSLIINFFKAQ